MNSLEPGMSEGRLAEAGVAEGGEWRWPERAAEAGGLAGVEERMGKCS